LKGLGRVIDKFCQKHRKFGVPRLMTYIVFVSAVMLIFANPEIIRNLDFRPAMILRGEIWRLITWVFLPVSTGMTMNYIFSVIALIFYYFIGSSLEREWGAGKFTIFYFFGLILNIIYGFAIWLIFSQTILISPMYLNLSMFFAFAVLFPNHEVRLYFIIPVKIKWLALLNAAFFLYSIINALIQRNIVMAILPFVAILNFILICGGEALAYLRPLRARRSPQTINFKKAAKQAKRNQAQTPYRHKCAVCGKTDTEFPNLEFRYCSRCDGYHCFCSDHINNHIHFQ